MDKRAGKRLEVNGRYTARIDKDKEFKIRDLSSVGMCLECHHSLIPNTTYDIEFGSGSNDRITAKGVVVRSFLKSFRHGEYDGSPLYHAGIKFVELKDREKKYLADLIERF